MEKLKLTDTEIQSLVGEFKSGVSRWELFKAKERDHEAGVESAPGRIDLIYGFMNEKYGDTHPFDPVCNLLFVTALRGAARLELGLPF